MALEMHQESRHQEQTLQVPRTLSSPIQPPPVSRLRVPSVPTTRTMRLIRRRSSLLTTSSRPDASRPIRNRRGGLAQTTARRPSRDRGRLYGTAKSYYWRLRAGRARAGVNSATAEPLGARCVAHAATGRLPRCELGDDPLGGKNCTSAADSRNVDARCTRSADRARKRVDAATVRDAPRRWLI